MAESSENWLDRFVGKNAWAILMLIISVSFWSATILNKVKAMEDKVSRLEDLISRIVVIEEKQRNMSDDITEIKADVKIVLQKVR